MTNPGMFGPRGGITPALPKGDVLGTYETYQEAQSVVDRLAHNAEFPLQQISIVGNDLKTIERVTGRLSYGRAALGGALSGLWFGFFVGILLSLFSTQIAFVPIIAAALIGAAAGLLFGVISYALTRRSRDFTSQTQVLATNYQVIVAPELSNRAQQVLAQNPDDAQQ